MNNATYMGSVSSVSSSSIIVELAESMESGIIIIEGKNYRIGQVGSFIKIPIGYNQLYGVTSESNESSTQDTENIQTRSRRWIKVELIGEMIGGEFDRGISEYPSIGDDVHIVVDRDLKQIFGQPTAGQFTIGKLSSSDGIDVSLDLDRLVTRHSAILGSTGSGKSTSTASIIRSIVTNNDRVRLPSARILLIDIHGEYESALGDIAKVFSVLPDSKNPLYIPYWCISPESLIDFLCGNISETHKTLYLDKTIEEKKKSIVTNNIQNIPTESVTTSTPLPYRIKNIWHELYYDDTVTWQEKEHTNPAYAKDGKGDAENLIPPKFLPPATSSNPPFKGGNSLVKRQLEQMKSRLLDSQYSFLLKPGPWTPDKDGKIEKDLDQLLSDWLGHDQPITILDLSGMPSSRLSLLLGSILDILFESAIWGKNLNSGMRDRPLLVVLEEAHRYLSKKEDGLAKQMVQRIAKEGRKFGVGAMVVSQRPSEIDETILSQCGTIIALRINNATDRGIVKAAMSEGLAGIIDSLPVLRTGEAIIVGESAKLPTRCRISLLPADKYPNSRDPAVTTSWAQDRKAENYEALVSAWRNQEITKEAK
ncbi:DNA helicase HerA-like ATPase [Pseudomonas corrugata]|uniref:ATP-binding protein n=1 Tax=Pseudomonas corrugata TaxID=47879 RepID=UPI002861922A|nr:ATP-binding protein [Pseudomonas corrugata]MDR7284134.1 DNA helicase HerA-like ATPase [Pseudomonas corrugata]